MNKSQLLSIALLALAILSSGCATITGTVTGPFTGLVDAPAQVYRHNRNSFDEHPINWALNIIFMVPIGVAGGAVTGFAKGVALDMEIALGNAHAGRVFGRYGAESVWRPYTLTW